MPDSVFDTIRKAELVYLYTSTRLSKYVNWSMYETVERIDAYLNSKHITGETDSLGREKPFFNIVVAAANIWYRATEIERTDIRFTPTNNGSVILAFVANIVLQQWMDKIDFDNWLNNWGRTLSRYGSAVSKFVEKSGMLYPRVVPWNRYIPDPVQFKALPNIEKFYLTPAQLRKNKLFNQTVVDQLILAQSTRKTLNKQPKNQLNDFIELYEVHGELDSRLLLDKMPEIKDASKATYQQQFHIVSYVQTGKDKYEDFSLYKGKETKPIYDKTDLIEEDGRTLAIGAVEFLFDAQWQRNHTVKNMKDTLDLASKLIFQTADAQFVGRNVLNAIETGDIMVHAVNQPLERIANDSPSITALMNYGAMWDELAQELTATPPPVRGAQQKSGTSFAGAALSVEQSQSLFEVMTKNKEVALKQIIKTYVVPFIKKQLKNKDQLVAFLDESGITEIDAMYIPHEAIRRYNKRALDAIASGQTVDPYNEQQEQMAVKKSLAASGNKRFFVPDEIDQKTWNDILSDFEWSNIRIETGSASLNKQAMLATLQSVFQTVAANPAILYNPNAMAVFSAILRETGAVSPIQLSTAEALPVPLPKTQLRENVDFKDLPPEAQQQLLARMGITITNMPPAQTQQRPDETPATAVSTSTPTAPTVGGVQ